MKKIILISSTILLIFSNGSPIKEVENVENDVKIFINSYVTRKTLFSYDFSKTFYCYEYDPTGYAIYDVEENKKIEFSFDNVSPYKDLSGILFYDGPFSYLYDYIDGNSKTLPKEISKKYQNNFEIKIPIEKTPILSKASEAPAGTKPNGTLIDNAELLYKLKNFNRTGSSYEYNRYGTCGYLAAAMVLYYNKYQYNNNFIADSYIETIDNEKRFTLSFHNLLVNIGSQNNIGNSTTAFDIKTVMEKYCESIGINTDHYAMLLSTMTNIDLCIRDNKPIILFGNFRNPVDDEKLNHAVVCYGIYNDVFNYNTVARYFVVNYGWTNHSAVYLIDNIFANPVGSMYNMNY